MKTATLSFLATMALGATVFADPVDWSAYAKSFDITFPGYTGQESLTDFPVLIRLSAARNGFRYDKCRQPDGGDLRFSDANGNLLASEVDNWDPAGESLVWVKVPSLNASTTITAHYGCSSPAAVNPKDVWSNGFLGVWHLNESSSPLADSLGLVNMTKSSTDPVSLGSNGVVGKAASFGENDEVNGRLTAKDSTSNRLSDSATLTVEAWLNQREMKTDRYALYKKNHGKAYLWQVASGGTKMAVQWGITNKSDAVAVVDVKHSYDIASTETWYHQASVFDNISAMKALTYIDGELKASSNLSSYPGYTVIPDDGDVYLGNISSGKAYPGSIDEFRISSVARSAEWVKATYDTVHDEGFARVVIPNDWKAYSHTFTLTFPLTGYPEGTTLTDFPVLVKVSATAIPGFLYTDLTKANGEDLRFADAEGNLLDSEIDIWDPNGESLIWVKVPSLSAGTTIKGYYGWVFAPAVNPKAVWSNGYLGVWHMNESARPVRDSSVNEFNFTRSYNYSPTDKYDDCVGFAQPDGAVGRSVKFFSNVEGKENQGGLLAPDAEGKLCGLAAMTIEIWAKTDTFDASRYLVSRRMGNTVNGIKYRGYEFSYSSSRKFAATFFLDNGANNDNDKCAFAPGAMSTSLTGQWNYHCASYDSSATVHTNYLNRTVAATVANSTGFLIHDVRTDPLCLGNDCQPGSTKVFNGSLDELRISNVARSAEWARATYDTIADNATFTTYSSAKENVHGLIIFFW